VHAYQRESKKTRSQSYLQAGDIELAQGDIDAIDAAGAIGDATARSL